MIKPASDIPPDAIAALGLGNKIEAIKLVRIAQSTGLKEAKEIVEQYLDQHPDIQQRMRTANAESARGSLGWMAILAGLAALAWYLFGR